MNAIVKDRNWLLGDNPTVLDIAWFITLHRVISAGFPMGNYPALNCLYKRMKARPSFHKEIKKGPVFTQVVGVVYRFFRRLKGSSLKAVYQLLGGRVDPALAARSSFLYGRPPTSRNNSIARPPFIKLINQKHSHHLPHMTG